MAAYGWYRAPMSSPAEQLPEDRRYSFGYSRGGEFQIIGHQRKLTKSDVMDRKYPQIADTNVYSDKSDMYLRDDQGQLYDLTPQWHYDRQHTKFDEEARDVVFQAQDYGSETTSGADNAHKN